MKRIIKLHSPSHLRRILGKSPTRCPIARLVFWGVVLFGSLKAAVLSGVVVDATNMTPLEGAHIVIKGLKKGSVSMKDGIFTLKDIPPGDWEVECSYMGYYTTREKFSFHTDSEINGVQFLLYPQSLSLNEVVTTATRTRKLLKDVPIVTEVFPREDFVRRGAVTASEALNTELGFQIQEDFSGQGITLQGADPDKVLILIDGNRVIGRIKGSVDLDQISVANVKQIEVVKGAVSTMYGSEAIGGVINIITYDPRPGLYIFGETKVGHNIPNHQPPNKIGLKGSHWSPGIRVGYGGPGWGIEGGLRYQHNPLMDLDPSTPHTEGVEEANRFLGDAKFIWELSPQWRINSSIRWMEEDKSWVEDAGLVSISVSYDDKENNRRNDQVIEFIHYPSTRNNYSLKLYLTDNFHLWEKWTQKKWGQPIVKDYSRADEDYREVSLTGGHKLSETHYLNW
ncbi:MAG: TonB-dependent receptor, partial [bacterium]